MGAAAGSSSSKPGEQWRGSGEGQLTAAATQRTLLGSEGKVLALFGAFLPMRLQTGSKKGRQDGWRMEGNGQSGLHKSHGARGLKKDTGWTCLTANPDNPEKTEL